MYSLFIKCNTRKTLKINVITNDWIGICTHANRDIKYYLVSAESLSAKYNKLRLVIMEYNVYSNAQVIL